MKAIDFSSIKEFNHFNQIGTEEFTKESLEHTPYDYPFIFHRGISVETDALASTLMGMLIGLAKLNHPCIEEYYFLEKNYSVALGYNLPWDEEHQPCKIETSDGVNYATSFSIYIDYLGQIRTIIYCSPESSDEDGAEYGVNDIQNPKEVINYLLNIYANAKLYKQ